MILHIRLGLHFGAPMYLQVLCRQAVPHLMDRLLQQELLLEELRLVVPSTREGNLFLDKFFTISA